VRKNGCHIQSILGLCSWSTLIHVFWVIYIQPASTTTSYIRLHTEIPSMPRLHGQDHRALDQSEKHISTSLNL
jgi:hypothetical protein